MELRDYQKEDVEKLTQLKVAGCFNQQRTGKTPTALKTIEKLNATKILILCPASAIPQWKEEYEKWLDKPCIAVMGTKSKKEKLIDSWTHGLVISYDSFKSTKNRDGLIEKILKKNPEAVIADEIHRCKNRRSANTEALYKCINIPIRLALTGTPAPGKPEDIFPILHFLRPTKYRSYWNFIDEYFIKQERINHNSGQRYYEILDFKPSKEQELQKELNQIATSRKRKDVMQWLPEKDYRRIILEPTKDQLKYFKELKENFETENLAVQGILDRLIRYRQLALTPEILGLSTSSPKIDWIKAYLTDYPDTPTIIFSKFTTFLNLLKEKVGVPVGMIIGPTSIEQRNKYKQDFQKGKLNLLLINIDAGKEALTLDRAEAAIFTDKYPPIGDILQAEDRFIATNEDKADKPHVIYELCLKGTYDEALYKLLQKRASSVDVINDFKKYLERK